MAGPEKCVRSNKICAKWCTYHRPKSPRKIIEPRVLEEKVCLFADIYLCKQLLPQINSCCQEVMQNNEMASSWSNHCLMLVASIKKTTQWLCWL